MIEVGYFPKLIEAAEGFDVPGLREICSVSHCISSGPDDWIEHWKHNDFGWFNTIVDAMSVVPHARVADYRLFAYRMYPYLFRSGVERPVDLPSNVKPEAIPRTFETIGFDAASRYMPDVLGLECSPLSCNYMAQELPVTEQCLFRTLEEAIAGARQFSVGNVEPGDYFVLEVCEENTQRTQRL
ncbi:MAG TPA: hypothetical protein VLK65_00030 [Vicinamibacteria bacterium]|nr:hypothetical protein [Vicinamibacteria bacterium]